jgi:hypothetical protein
VIDFPDVYHTLLGWPCFTKFMAIPNYTYLNLKMPSPKGVITVKGSFKQAYYYEQDCVTQAATLVAPCAPNSPGRDTGKVSAKEATKAAAVPDHPGIGDVAKTPGDSNGSVGPFVKAFSPRRG